MGSPRVLHFLIALHFWFGCYYDWNYVIIPEDIIGKGASTAWDVGKLKFLTYWDALLQALFFTVCFLNDVIGTNDYSPSKIPLIRRIKDIMLPTLCFPISMFVSVSFWGIYAVDRELILPKALDAFFPSWLNHVMHTNILLFTFMEMVISYRKYPSRRIGLSILLIFMLSYLTWIHILNAYSGVWVYPILNVLNFPFRVLFFVGNLIFAIVCYMVGEKINSARWCRMTKDKNIKTK